MDNETKVHDNIRFGALTFRSSPKQLHNLPHVPKWQHAPQDISTAMSVPFRRDQKGEKRRHHESTPPKKCNWTSPYGPGPSQRDCLLCNTPVKRGEVMEHRQGWLHIDRSRTKGFYCELCNKAFLGPFGIRMHCERSHPPPDVDNLLADAGYTTSTRKERKRIKALSMSANLLQEARNVPPCPTPRRSGVFCVICSTDRAPGEKRRSHKRSQQHIDMCKEQGLYCSDCDIIFDTSMEQCLHADTHEISSSKRCNICYEEMVETRMADVQLQIHNDTFKRCDLVCLECNTDFGIDKENFLAHVLKSHVPPRPVKFNCSHCNQNFQFEEYIRHSCLNPTNDEITIAASYPAEELKPIECVGSSKCERRFKKLSEMIQHLEGGQCIENPDSMGINVLVCRNYPKIEEFRHRMDQELDSNSRGGRAGQACGVVKLFSLVQEN
ncbi:hypothetical protein BDD12DRAFT_861930 [Trichophaea hybrida]|nr:hypothetical protein BDD12DRAFT_861930 [Trichophaea hybrida]